MIDHFEIKVVRFKECEVFYSTVLLPLNVEKKWADDAAAGFGLMGENKVRFLIEHSEASSISLAHIAFVAPSTQSVGEFHQAGITAGFRCNGEPGLREDYAPNYYAAFLLDPDGNNIEAVIMQS